MIADAEGVDPVELSYSLENYVPCETLDTLVERSSTPWQLTFQVPDHTVTVTGDGTIYLDDDIQELESMR